MGIELFWDNDEENVMLCVFDRNWTWEEMFDTLDAVKRVTARRDYEIGAIIDVSQGISVPGGSIFNADTREKAMKMMRMGEEEGRGPMVIVGANGFIKNIHRAVNMLDKDATNDVYFAKTADEARRILAQRLASGREIPA